MLSYLVLASLRKRARLITWPSSAMRARTYDCRKRLVCRRFSCSWGCSRPSYRQRAEHQGPPNFFDWEREMAKVLCVLYDDPVGGYPKSYARDDIPELEHYPDGQKLPTPQRIDFKPGQLLGSVSGELGLRKFLEEHGHTLIVTSDKDGPGSVFERELPDTEVVISQPFWPAYLTRERIAKAPKLKLALTAGIGSDHVDLQAAIERRITVAEVTYCNSISVSEHVVMMILSLVRNYIPSYQWVVKKGWNAREELVAELGAAFLCADLGITPEPREDHAAYLGHWLQVRREDKRAIFSAAAHA